MKFEVGSTKSEGPDICTSCFFSYLLPPTSYFLLLVLHYHIIKLSYYHIAFLLSSSFLINPNSRPVCPDTDEFSCALRMR
jgi:hypothetical protein